MCVFHPPDETDIWFRGNMLDFSADLHIGVVDASVLTWTDGANLELNLPSLF